MDKNVQTGNSSICYTWCNGVDNLYVRSFILRSLQACSLYHTFSLDLLVCIQIPKGQKETFEGECNLKQLGNQRLPHRQLFLNKEVGTMI